MDYYDALLDFVNNNRQTCIYQPLYKHLYFVQVHALVDGAREQGKFMRYLKLKWTPKDLV